MSIVSGVGPVFEQPVNSVAEVNRLVEHRISDASTVEKAMTLAVAELGETTPVIGFAGAPFTLAAYLVEGRGSRDHLGARAFMHAEPAAWDRLLTWCADLSGEFLRIQVKAGARAVQLFDSWVGTLCLDDYTTRVAPYSRRVLESVSVPRIHFGTGAGHLLEAMAECGSEAIGIDHRIPLDEAARRLPGKVLQGNIDPARLAAGWENLATHTKDVVERGRSAPAHVVNLGHGVPPETDPAVLTDLVALVHEL